MTTETPAPAKRLVHLEEALLRGGWTFRTMLDRYGLDSNDLAYTALRCARSAERDDPDRLQTEIDFVLKTLFRLFEHRHSILFDNLGLRAPARPEELSQLGLGAYVKLQVEQLEPLEHTAWHWLNLRPVKLEPALEWFAKQMQVARQALNAPGLTDKAALQTWWDMPPALNMALTAYRSMREETGVSNE